MSNINSFCLTFYTKHSGYCGAVFTAKKSQNNLDRDIFSAILIKKKIKVFILSSPLHHKTSQKSQEARQVKELWFQMTKAFKGDHCDQGAASVSEYCLIIVLSIHFKKTSSYFVSWS